MRDCKGFLALRRHIHDTSADFDGRFSRARHEADEGVGAGPVIQHNGVVGVREQRDDAGILQVALVGFGHPRRTLPLPLLWVIGLCLGWQ